MAVLTAYISTASVSDIFHSPEPDQRDQHEDDDRDNPAPPLTISPGSAETARAETIFDHLMEIFIVTRGTRVIVKAGLDIGTFQTTAYRHLINASTTPNQHPLWSTSAATSEWYTMLRIQCLEDLVGGATANKPERDICASAITCLEEVHDGAARLLEYKKERLWNLQKNDALRYDFVWLLKWTAVVSQEFLALIHKRHQAAMVILAQFVAICDLFEYQWYLKNWVRNAMAAIRHILGSSKANSWVDKIVERWLIQSRS
ncbi:hypothetical protein NW762_012469 [Fusarium torreyae]|uniref:Uncharacterized protein n=1 Tax=Fusarium torreyae TaxID=1237075 RepID=A0A9W8VBD4_9HYPO|nr:hypothetical protein NW762_012469 [Fusarium torreyae]